MKNLLLIITGIFSWSFGISQTSISGQINTYTAVTAAGTCPNKLNVSNPTGFNANDTVLVIQMQGATIDESNSGNFGQITNNGAGLYEKATIATIDGNEITFYKDLVNFYSYDHTAGNVQIVNIPQYTDVTVSGTLVAAPWNGTIGGVLAFEASGTVTLNANISVDGLGFRGGAMTNDPNNDNECGPFDSRDDYFYNENSLFSAFKGEGIAQVISGKELGRGAQANGGGGGNDHNSGGAGGGGNGFGGNGGRNNEPSFFRCKGQYPGIGGKTVNEAGRIFFGGGGGGGHSNNSSGSAGGSGGGIIYISANSFNGNGRTISANGISAQNGVGDGVGGGGAGGTILLKVNNFTTDLLIAQANGGNGASVDNSGGNRCFGPGGGGGGGIVAITTDPIADPVEKSATGGVAGITFNTSNGCEGSTNGASAGGDGTITNLLVIPEGTEIPEVSCNPLPVDFVSFTATLLSGKVQLNWVTGSETNNEYFSIERSEDGQQFVQLARITGKGTYTALSTYQTTDPNPLTGVSYYRIRQVDYDRKFTHSKTVSIENQEAGMAINLFPNPVQHSRSFFLKITSPVTETLHIQIVNTLGEHVLTRTETLQSGQNTFEISTSGLSAGMYLVQVRSGNSFKVLRLQLL